MNFYFHAHTVTSGNLVLANFVPFGFKVEVAQVARAAPQAHQSAYRAAMAARRFPVVSEEEGRFPFQPVRFSLAV